jgi:hypothetical protein
MDPMLHIPADRTPRHPLRLVVIIAMTALVLLQLSAQ